MMVFISNGKKLHISAYSGHQVLTVFLLKEFYLGVSESKVPYFFATKILHIIRCLFLQLLLTSFTIFSRSQLLC